MPKDTFNNLPIEKRDKVIKVLKRLFQEKPFKDVTVKEIVDELSIARGSFYQYFENLEDAYFTILDQEVTDIHMIFINILVSQDKNLKQALNNYGKKLSEILFEKESYMIYLNRYLYWDENLSKKWNEVHDYNSHLFTNSNDGNYLDFEHIHYVKAVIHSLIQRNYRENWTKEEFIENYNKYVNWIIKGVD